MLDIPKPVWVNLPGVPEPSAGEHCSTCTPAGTSGQLVQGVEGERFTVGNTIFRADTCQASYFLGIGDFVVGNIVGEGGKDVCANVPRRRAVVRPDAPEEPCKDGRLACGRGDGLECVDVDALRDVQVRPRAPADDVPEALVGVWVNVAGGAVRVCWVEVAFERGLRKLELRGEDGDVDEVHHFVCGFLLVRHVADRVEAHAPAVGAPREKIDGIMY